MMTGLSEVALPQDELRSRIPTGYKRVPPQVSGGEKEFLKGIEFPNVLPVWEFNIAGRLRVSSRPIGITLSREADAFLAFNDALGICATGQSSVEAILGFLDQLSHFVQYYNSLRNDQVTGLARRLKALFGELFPQAKS
jgi:hypothetical protein